VNTFNNSKVRAAAEINPKTHVDEFYTWLENKFQKEIDSRKSAAGKTAQSEKKNKVLEFFTRNKKSDLIKIFEISVLIAKAKKLIIEKMNKASNIATFVKTKNGFKVTGVEGFVAIDRLSGNAVKIVDRMEFSTNNFSPEILKGFDIRK
jgi:hypothetical protein